MGNDRIEKKIRLRAPRERVWRAIAEAERFGYWFGVRFDGAFAPGARLTARIAPTQVDAEVAKLQQPHAGKAFGIVVDRIEPMRLFSFRWHPFAIDPHADYESEPMTLVTFTLEEAGEETLLTIVESGFEQLPPGRRDAAFRSNDGGWSHQAALIEKYLAMPRAE